MLRPSSSTSTGGIRDEDELSDDGDMDNSDSMLQLDESVRMMLRNAEDLNNGELKISKGDVVRIHVPYNPPNAKPGGNNSSSKVSPGSKSANVDRNHASSSKQQQPNKRLSAPPR